MIDWGWKPERPLGVWRCGAEWLRPFFVAVPYLTVGLLMMQFYFVGGTLTTAKGVLFDLPAGDLADGETTGVVAIVMPMRHETMVYFDDSRYVLGDASSVRAFGEHLAERIARSESRTLLVLADRRIVAGDLMGLADIARRSGVGRILFAEKRTETAE